MDDATTHFFIKHHINIMTIVYIGYVKEEEGGGGSVLTILLVKDHVI